jgi:hypothetical protein
MAGKTYGLIAAVVVVCILCVPGLASADTVNQIIKPDAYNSAHDNNAEILLNSKGSVDTDGFLNVGDVIIGAINFNQLNSSTANLGGLTGNSQWSGVFALEVKDLRNVSGAGTYAEKADIIFGAWSGLDAFLNNSSTGLDIDSSTSGIQNPDGPSVASGTIGRLWENSTSTVDFETALGGGWKQNLATAATGSFYWDLGFASPSDASHWDTTTSSIVSDNGEGWVVLQGQTYLKYLQNQNDGTTFTKSNFGMSLLQQGTSAYGIQAINDWTDGGLIGATVGDTVDVIGSSTVKGALNNVGNAGFWAKSSTDMNFYATPLPAAVLPGLLLLLGLSAVQYRRRRRYSF